MTVHLSYNNMIIQCINRTWGIDFWDETLLTTSITSKYSRNKQKLIIVAKCTFCDICTYLIYL